MLVHFESDNIVNKSGFDVTYSSTTTPSGAIDNQGYCTELTTFTLPAGSFHDGSGSGIDYLSNTYHNTKPYYISICIVFIWKTIITFLVIP